jgi:hypothetical protein
MPPPGGYPPPGFPPPGGPTPPNGGGSKTGLIIGIVVLVVVLIAGAATAAILLLTGDDDSDSDSDTRSTSEPTDEPTDDPDEDEDVDLDDGPWYDVVEDFTTSYYDGDCVTLMELTPGNWQDEASCLAAVMPGAYTLDDYEVTTLELDDEQDPTEATVEVDYMITSTSTGQVQTYLTTFTVSEDGGDWIVTDFRTG